MSLWTDDGYVVGVLKQPGRNADYRGGRHSGELNVTHYTVGRDSTAIGLRGVFKWLLPKVGPAKQFSPWGARDAHACEWNVRGPGIETEKLGDWEPTTDDQIESYALITAALAEKGIPLTWWNGPRLPVGSDLIVDGERRGHIAHRSLVHRACDQHTDYLPDEDMARIMARAAEIGGGGPPAPRRRRRKDTDVTMEIFSANTDGGKPWPPTGVHLLVVTQPSPEGPRRDFTYIDLAQTLGMIANGSAAHFGGDRGQVEQVLDGLGLPKFPPT